MNQQLLYPKGIPEIAKARESSESSELVDMFGRPLLQSQSDSADIRTQMLRFLIESTGIVAFGTGLLFVIGFSYYRGYFGYFGGILLFPSLATTDYLTKAFELLSSPLVIVLAFIWAGFFGLVWELRGKIEETEILRGVITQQRRVIGQMSWEIFDLKRRFSVKERMAISMERNSNRKKDEKYHDYRLISSRKDAMRLFYRFAPYEISLKTIVYGITWNSYWVLSYIAIFVAANRLDMNISEIVIGSIPLSLFVAWSIATGQSAFHELRRRFRKSVAQRIYYTIFAIVGIGYLAIAFAESAGKYDAQQFAENSQSRSVVAMVDVGQSSPWLQLGSYKVILIRDGLYYAIPSQSVSGEKPSLYVFPIAAVVSVDSETPDMEDSISGD